MDAMKMALKKHLDGLKGNIDAIDAIMGEGSPDEEAGETPEVEDQEMKDNTELAPELHGKDAMPKDGEGDAMQVEILKGLSDSGHGGRAGMSLHEKATAGAKGKLASLMKK